MKTKYHNGVTLKLTTTECEVVDPSARIWIIVATIEGSREVTFGPYTRPQAIRGLNALAPAFGAIEQAFADVCLAIDTFSLNDLGS